MFPDNKKGIRIIEGSKTSFMKHFTIKIYTAFKKEKFISLQLKKMQYLDIYKAINFLQIRKFKCNILPRDYTFS